ncbi:carboxypeptidase-like regulatory domain-containing protein [Odoribacter lunatus]|uniref:carboxypeptidase-like regulatory domain-containing protein n=1 Tax=Odoribacter lunatus TaxID=2941335 RepID=UPI00203E2FC4|nr:carboxypeptidase-like regulatory domain-containing protein [Odoribacter lunatus]
MNKKVLSLFIVLFMLVIAVKAQDDSRIIIKGTVTDASNDMPIPFANLGVLGTLAGVASNMDGEFELQLPDSYRDKVIRVSVVGYRPQDIKVAEAIDKPELKIALQPVVYTIQQVDVNAQSLVYRKMLRQAVDNIGKNYFVTTYSYRGYFQYLVFNEDVQTASTEAIVTIYDKKGYHRNSVETAFKEVNYRYNEVRRSKEPQSVLDGLTYFDDVLTADIVRNPRNILDVANVRDYKLTNKGRLLFEDDSVQVIGYEAINPTLSTTGSIGVTKYSGEIYINLKDYAVLKNSVHLTATDYSTLGRNLIPSGEYGKGTVSMTITTNYKKLGSRYFLSGVTLQYSYVEGEDKISGKMQYVTTQVKTTNPETVEGRMYYEDIKSNPKFWDNYTVYFEN